MMLKNLIYSLTLIFFTLGCSHPAAMTNSKDQKTAQPSDNPSKDELSLKSDRSALDDERKQIPAEVKRSNDELALVLEIMKSTDDGELQEPSKVRDRFDRAVRERRSKLDKEIRQSRDSYSQNEKSSREKYFAKLKAAREEFSKEKHDSSARNEFFGEQDEKRRGFVAEQQEKRSSFESDMKDKRKNFDDYIHERQNSFNEEYRSYVKRYEEFRKASSLKKKMQEKERESKQESLRNPRPEAPTHSSKLNDSDQKDLDDLKSFPKGPSEPLGQ